jgi:two-component system, NarL family, sensor histidine kinase UhpB
MSASSISTPSVSDDGGASARQASSATRRAPQEGAPRVRRISLLWQIFAVNALVLVAAAVLLIVTPVTISAPISLAQAAIVLGGLAAMLAADLMLLRRTLAPLRRLTTLIAAVDPKRPGRRVRLRETHDAEVSALAEAFNATLDRLETERQQSAGRALAAQEDERLRIARELHDQVGQTLTAVTIQADRAVETDGAVPKAMLEQIASAARDGLDDVRRIARELRPEALDDLGLINALITLCRRVSDQGGIRVEQHFESGLPPLTPEAELVIYRIAQESLTNAIRHADPSTVQVSLASQPGGVVLTVRDDGCGMSNAPPQDTAGISGMRERALLLHGRLSIDSQPGQGTQVTLEIPVDQPPA